MRTYEEAMRAYKEDCARIAEQCEEEGYPSHGSNYELRVDNLEGDYPELFDPDYWEEEED